jgi:hypothetical protein
LQAPAPAEAFVAGDLEQDKAMSTAVLPDASALDIESLAMLCLVCGTDPYVAKCSYSPIASHDPPLFDLELVAERRR